MENLRKYIRESLKEAYVNDDGELVEFDHKINYPHKKIGKLISYYIDSNFENWAKMGWAVFDSYYGEDKYNSETDTVWRAEKIDNPEDWDIPVIVNLKDDSEAREKALDAGFEVDEDGVIIGLYGVTLVDKLQESNGRPKRIVVGTLIKDTSTNKVLLLKRNDKSPTWAMMTGEIDQGESALDGLEREMYEELFIKPGSVRLNYKGIEHILDKNIDLHYFEGFVNEQFKPILDEENLDYGWFSLEDLPSPLFGGIYKRIEQLLQKDNVYSNAKLADKETVNENLQLADKVYFTSGKLSPRVREIITTKITGSDAWTKLVTDIYYAMLQDNLRKSEWLGHFLDNPGAEIPPKKDEYKTSDDVMNIDDWREVKSYYQQLKSYNKNVFPIEGLNSNGVEDIWSIIRALKQRATILEKIKSLPSIALRNMREDIRTPRNGEGMNQYRHDLEHFLAYYSLLDNRDAELKKFVENKMFKSGVTLEKLLYFVEDKENLLGGKRFDKDVIKNIIEDNNHGELEIIYEQGDIMIVEVGGPYGIKEIGCNSLWCFTYGEGYSRNWSQYSYNDTVYVIIDFSEPTDSREFMHVVIKPIVYNYDIENEDNEEINDGKIFDMSNVDLANAISYLESTIGLDTAKKLLTFYEEPEYEEDGEDISSEKEQKDPNQLSLFETRKYIRVILEQRIFSEQYLDEALSILSESDEPSPTFTWDLAKEDKPSPEFTWDLAKEKIDLSKKYVQTKEQAVEYLKKFFEKIKSLPRELKIRLAKYVVSGFVGLVGIGIISSLMSSTMPDVEKEVVKTIVVKQEPKKQEYVRPTKVSNELLNFLKHEEGSIINKGEPVLKAYKLGDGAVTVGWGHAEKIRDTKLRPGQIITRDQAEAYFNEDVAEAKSYVDDMLNDWEKEGVKPRITQSMYDAMVSMVYNMGVGTFRFSDRSEELIKYLKTNQFDKASEEIKKVSAHLYNKFPGLETRRDAESEMFASDLNANTDSSTKLAMNEVEIIDETYQGQKDLEKLASDSLKYLAEYIVYDSAYDFENTHGLNLPSKYLPSAIHTKHFIKNIDGYAEIKNFLEDINNITISFFKKEKPSSVEGSYNGSRNNRATINMFYEEKTLDTVNKLLRLNGYSYSDNLVHEVYFDLYHDLFSTLLHEFQHAYDDWRSKGKAFKFPKKYSEKDDVYKNIRNKEYSELSQEEKEFADSHYDEYQNLMHEINARFAQTIKKVKFINIAIGDGYEKTLAPWDEVLRNFRWNFQGWKVASDKRKRRLVQRLAKIYQEKGEELIEEKNKNK